MRNFFSTAVAAASAAVTARAQIPNCELWITMFGLNVTVADCENMPLWTMAFYGLGANFTW